jgi:phage protein D
MNGNGTVRYASHPVISIDGEVKAGLGDNLLISLLVEESKAGFYRCEARFTNWNPMASQPYPLFDRHMIDFGKTFAVRLGPPDTARQVFNGRITAMEGLYPANGSAELTLLAEDRFQDLRMERRTRTFEDVSDGDVVQTIASQHGLTAQVDVDGPTYRVLTQLNQSDLAFLRERAMAVDAQVWVEDRTLHFQARTQRDGSEVSLMYGGNLYDFSVLADLAHQRTSIRVSGWDIVGKRAIDEEATASVISGELGQDRSGSTILAQALAERHERVVTDVPLSTDEARHLAESRYRERARRFLTGRGLADGTPEIQVGSTVDISGVGPLFAGRYTVILARHTFDERGYRTMFEVERPGIGG